MEKLTNEDILDLLYCSFEEDPSGMGAEVLIQSLMVSGIEGKTLMLIQQEASFLYNKNAF